MDLILTANGTLMDSGSDSADPWGTAQVELFDQGQLGDVYGVQGLSTVLYNDTGGYYDSGGSYYGDPWGFYDGNWGYFNGESNDDGLGDTIFAGDLYVSEATGPPPPYVDHIRPILGGKRAHKSHHNYLAGSHPRRDSRNESRMLCRGQIA